MRSSPERDADNNSVAEVEKVKHVMKEDEKSQRINKEDMVVVEMEKVKAKAEETESHKTAITVQKERGIDLQLQLEKSDRLDTNGNDNGNNLNQKQHHNGQRHQHQLQQQHQTVSEKNGKFNFEVKNTCFFLLIWCLMWLFSSTPCSSSIKFFAYSNVCSKLAWWPSFHGVHPY